LAFCNTSLLKIKSKMAVSKGQPFSFYGIVFICKSSQEELLLISSGVIGHVERSRDIDQRFSNTLTMTLEHNLKTQFILELVE
jgi:hypothetical protein